MKIGRWELRWPWVSRRRYQALEAALEATQAEANRQIEAAAEREKAMRLMFERQLERLIRVTRVQTNSKPHEHLVVEVKLANPLFIELSPRMPKQEQIDYLATRAGQYLEGYLKNRPHLFDVLDPKDPRNL